MIIRATKEQIADYYADPAMNQSKLKILPRGIQAFNNVETEEEAILYFEEKTHFIIGQGVDTILTQGDDEFSEAHFVSEIEEKPSDKLMSIAQQVFDIQIRMGMDIIPMPSKVPDKLEILPNDPQSNLFSYIIESCEFHNYQSRWGAPAKLKAVLEGANVYYNELVKSVGKTIISLKEYGIIKSAANSLQTNPITKWVFADQEGIDTYFQLPIYFTYREVEFKALLDVCKVDHVGKTIQVIDCKTLGGLTINFPSSVRKFRYDFQTAFYSIAISHHFRVLLNTGYKLLMPAFAVETTLEGKQGNPLIYECTSELMFIAMDGQKLYSSANPYFSTGEIGNPAIRTSLIYGIDETISLYKWHLEYGFNRDKVDVINNGIIPLKWEGWEV